MKSIFWPDVLKRFNQILVCNNSNIQFFILFFICLHYSAFLLSVSEIIVYENQLLYHFIEY